MLDYIKYLGKDLEKELIIAKHEMDRAIHGQYIAKKRKYRLSNRNIKNMLRTGEDIDMRDLLHI